MTQRTAVDNQPHWDDVYQTKSATSVSWHQQHARQSLAFIFSTDAPKKASIIDVGSGASTLIDDLIAEGFTNITALDIAESGLAVTRQRLGDRADLVQWLVTDIANALLPSEHFDIWHDRAVFHFLVDAKQRQKYLENMQQSVKAGGHIIMATFAEDGPEKCSGLSVMRYSAESLTKILGPAFELLETRKESHQTPAGNSQSFIYCRFRKL